MADIFALNVSMGKSYGVWYRGKQCIKEFQLVHTRSGFSNLLDMVKQAQTPIIYFEATGIYSQVIESFCEINGLRFCRLNPLELHLKSASLRRVKTEQKDAHRIALTVQENTFRLTVPWSKDYLTLHELSRFYNQLNADWNYRLNHLHTALEQVFPELKQLFVNRTSKLALNIVELFPHPALVRPYSRVKLKNILMASTNKRISKMKAYKYADRLIDLAPKIISGCFWWYHSVWWSSLLCSPINCFNT